MIIPKQIFVWAQRLFLYGAVAAIGVFLIVVAAGSWTPRGLRVTGDMGHGTGVVKATALDVNALPSLVGDIAMLPAVKSPTEIKKVPNLTEQFAASLAKGIVAKNPSGPGAGAQRKLVAPNINAALDQFLKTEVSAPQELAHISSTPPDVVDNVNIEMLGEYTKKFSAIFNDWVAGRSFVENPDDFAQFFSSVSTAQRESAQRLQQLAVPRQFLDVHERAVGFLLTNSALAAQLSRVADNDPLRATLLLGAFQRMRADGFVIAQDAIAIFARAIRYALHS